MTIKTAAMLGACSLALSGCGTVATVLQNDEDAARGLRQQKTYCQSIPRLYSGLAYDFCVLNAPPDPTGVLLPLVLLDLGLSGVLDSVFLPYTIYRQGSDGNLRIYWRPSSG
ncbi:YceK/YidQ family lipoprotein [Pseudomonas sp. GB2N2]